MNPYAAPGSKTEGQAEPSDASEDIAAASPPTLARLAGGGVALAGVVVGLTGAQTLAMVSIRGPLAAAPWVLLLSGITELVLATFVFRARARAALLAIVWSFGMVLSAGGWLFVSLTHGLFSLYALGGPGVALGAAVLALLALGPSRRASEARARLKAQGMDLGI